MDSKITLLKYSKLLYLMLLAILIFSCSEDDGDEYVYQPPGGGSGSVAGIWTRYPGPSGDRTDLAIGGIAGEPANRVYMCEKEGSATPGLFKGSISGNTIVWDSQYGLPNSNVQLVNGDLVLSYPSVEWSIPTSYGPGSWGGDCGSLSSGGGGGGGTSGDVAFWTQSDLGCGYINVSVGGQSGTVTGYYSGGSPGCGASGAANFTLPAGTYNYSAGCGDYTWNGTVTVSAGGCSTMRLYL